MPCIATLTEANVAKAQIPRTSASSASCTSWNLPVRVPSLGIPLHLVYLLPTRSTQRCLSFLGNSSCFCSLFYQQHWCWLEMVSVWNSPATLGFGKVLRGTQTYVCLQLTILFLRGRMTNICTQKLIKHVWIRILISDLGIKVYICSDM